MNRRKYPVCLSGFFFLLYPPLAGCHRITVGLCFLSGCFIEFPSDMSYNSILPLQRTRKWAHEQKQHWTTMHRIRTRSLQFELVLLTKSGTKHGRIASVLPTFPPPCVVCLLCNCETQTLCWNCVWNVMYYTVNDSCLPHTMTRPMWAVLRMMDHNHLLACLGHEFIEKVCSVKSLPDTKKPWLTEKGCDLVCTNVLHSSQSRLHFPLYDTLQSD